MTAYRNQLQTAAFLNDLRKHDLRAGKPVPMGLEGAIEWTPVHFGGRRPWFTCPGCGRRSRVLYDLDGWCCRVCVQAIERMFYQSQWASETDRALRRVTRLKWLLRDEPQITGDLFGDAAALGVFITWLLGEIPERRPGHWRSRHERRCRKLRRAQAEAIRLLTADLRRGLERLQVNG